MTSKLSWLIRQQLKKVWVRVVAFACLAVGTVYIARVVGQFVPVGWTTVLNAEAVDRLLEIMASSMLAVTTFSLSVAVSAFTAATQTTTPRATTLLQQDPTTQNVLATFLGAFIFSLVGLLALKGGFYTGSGIVVLFAATAIVVTLVVLAFLRWIAHIMTFGRMGDTLDRVEEAASEAIRFRLENPCLGGVCDAAPAPETTHSVTAATIGYLQHVDMQSLNDIARKRDMTIWLSAVPGAYVHATSELARCDREADEETQQAIRSSFTCGKERNFDQDPRFGVIVLAEIASRALSPAVNDPGTAIEVLTRLVRVLARWRNETVETPQFEHVHVQAIQTDDILRDAFETISRDAAHSPNVLVRLQKALVALSDTAPDSFRSAATTVSQEVNQRAGKADLLESERREISNAAGHLLCEVRRAAPSTHQTV